MKDEMNIEDFEQFLKTQADKNRMYPDDQVWRNINQQLHGNHRWPALTFAAILTGALLIASLIFLHPDKDLFKLSPVSDNLPAKQVSAPTIANNRNFTKTGAVDMGSILKPVNEEKAIYSFNYQPRTPEDDASNEDEFTMAVTAPALSPTVLEAIPVNEVVAQNSFITGYKNMDRDIQPVTVLSGSQYPHSATVSEVTDNDLENREDDLANKLNAANNDVASKSNETYPEEIIASKDWQKNEPNKKRVPKHLTVQVYGGSSISYRMLSEPAAMDYHFPYNSAITSNPRSNVNNFVRQRPAVGFELGAAFLYPLSDRLMVKAGLQFNYRQYNIDASSSVQQPSVLLLNNAGGMDSILVYSAIRNADGYKPLTLRNRYFQVGLPVGIVWTIAERNKVKFSLGGTIQPTYQLNTNIFMITSDYKSYTQRPDMIRRWNINGGVEAMATFKAGGLQWQVGPQLRYQMLPTQINSYSVHEHLIDYGIKFGVLKQLK